MQEKLRSLYKKDPHNKLPSFLGEEHGYRSIEGSYINLAIVDRKAQQERKATLLFSSSNTAQEIDAELDSFEDNIDESNTIDIRNLFLNSRNKKKGKGKEKVGIFSNNDDEIEEVEEQESDQYRSHQRILIYGGAGIGKTTLMKYITYQWTQGELWNQFEYVFLLPLRKLNNFQKTNNHDGIESFIIECCLRNEHINFEIKKDVQALKSILSNNKILLLLDGYDEFNPKEENKDFVRSILEAVFNQPKLSIIMTSRPNMVESRYKKLFDYQLVNIGFSNVNIDDYIEKNFTGKEEEKQSLYKLIKENKTIQGMCHTPLNLHLLCLVWVDLLNKKQGKIESQEFSTTNLCVEIVDWLIRRYVSKTKNKKLAMVMNLKHEQIEESYEASLKLIEKVAFEGLPQGKTISFKETLSKQGIDAESYEEILKIGLLKTIDRNESADQEKDKKVKDKEKNKVEVKSNIEKEHYFIHLIFQEYMAAQYLVRMLNSNIKEQVKLAVEFLDNNKYAQRYERMVSFIAGIVSLNKDKNTAPSQGLLHFWNVMINGKVDLSIVKQLNLIIKCMDESGIDERIPEINNIRDYLKDTMVSIKEVKGWKAIEKVPERVERWLEVSKSNNGLGAKQESSSLPTELERESSKSKIEEEIDEEIAKIEDTRKLEIKSQVSKMQAKVLPKIVDSNDEIYNQVREILHRLEIPIEHEELKQLVNYILINEGIKEDELISKIEQWIKELPLLEVNEYIKKAREVIQQEHLMLQENILMLSLSNYDKNIGINTVLKKRTLNNSKPQESIVNDLLLLLADKDPYIQINTINSLSELVVTDPKTQVQIVKALVNLLKDTNIFVSMLTMITLGKLETDSIELQQIIVNNLLPLLKDKDYYMRAFTMITLGEFKTDNIELQEVIVNSLLPLLKDQDCNISIIAADSLSKFNINSSNGQLRALNKIFDLLKHTDKQVCNNSISVLGKLNITDSSLQMMVLEKLSNLLEELDIRIITNVLEVIEHLQIMTRAEIDSSKLINKLIKVITNIDQHYLADREAEEVMLRIIDILNNLSIQDPYKFKNIFDNLIDKFILNQIGSDRVRLSARSLVNVFLEESLTRNISVVLTLNILRLFNLPLFKQAAIVVEKNKVVVSYRGYQREMHFAESENKANMAYKIFSYFYQQNQQSGIATNLLDYQMNFSKPIQISKFDVELGNITLAKSVLQQHSYSCVNNGTRLSCQQWMVSVIKKGKSVDNTKNISIIIEGRNIFQEAELYRLELLQYNLKSLSDRGVINIIENPSIDISKPGELARIFQTILGNTKYNGNNGFKIDRDYYHKSCVVARDTAVKIINQTKDEKEKAIEIQYDPKGIKGLNCLNWIRTKLKDNLTPKEYESLQLENSKERASSSESSHLTLSKSSSKFQNTNSREIPKW